MRVGLLAQIVSIETRSRREWELKVMLHDFAAEAMMGKVTSDGHKIMNDYVL